MTSRNAVRNSKFVPNSYMVLRRKKKRASRNCTFVPDNLALQSAEEMDFHAFSELTGTSACTVNAPLHYHSTQGGLVPTHEPCEGKDDLLLPFRLSKRKTYQGNAQLLLKYH